MGINPFEMFAHLQKTIDLLGVDVENPLKIQDLIPKFDKSQGPFLPNDLYNVYCGKKRHILRIPEKGHNSLNLMENPSSSSSVCDFDSASSESSPFFETKDGALQKTQPVQAPPISIIGYGNLTKMTRRQEVIDGQVVNFDDYDLSDSYGINRAYKAGETSDCVVVHIECESQPKTVQITPFFTNKHNGNNQNTDCSIESIEIGGNFINFKAGSNYPHYGQFVGATIMIYG